MNGKIKTLEELARITRKLKSEGKKVVHCHGVFDLLHIGHIRHLNAALKKGDRLVVTITPDRYVNKGPGRPAFAENLRLEAIASLDCVDYVALNKWATAVETLKKLQPDFYAKGQDYRDMTKDLSGGIAKEKEAVESVGGKIVFTNEITFSSSRLLTDYHDLIPKDAVRYLKVFRDSRSTEEVIGFLKSASRLKVLVIGEAIIDEYQYCNAIGKSSKEPTLVVKSTGSEKFAGGILAVANHLADFAGEVQMVTFLGSKNSHEKFIRSNLSDKVKARFLKRKDSPTIVKRRFIDEYFFSKLFEVYEYNDSRLSKSDNNRLCGILEEIIPEFDVVMVVDFGHGMISREAVEILCDKSSFLTINAQANAGNFGYNKISKYHRADYVSTAEKEIRLTVKDHAGELKNLIKEVSSKQDYGRIAVTRGSYGCMIYEPTDGFSEVPAFTRRVVDRIGSGDAFLAITALCAAQGAPSDVMGFIGNAVGSQAVASVGNKEPIRKIPLLKYIETLMK